ncbi:hypothetical protein GBAR_LOCUS12103, partial [Geodia barretti]
MPRRLRWERHHFQRLLTHACKASMSVEVAVGVRDPNAMECVYSYLHTRLIGSDVEGGRERRSHVRYGGDAAVAEKSPD